MQPVIKPSSELRKNYNSVAEICRSNKIPVFLTRNGEGDMVIMDIETYGRREENLAIAERLVAAEMARLMGTQGYTVDEFKNNMLKAIKQGASKQNPPANMHVNIGDGQIARFVIAGAGPNPPNISTSPGDCGS